MPTDLKNHFVSSPFVYNPESANNPELHQDGNASRNIATIGDSNISKSYTYNDYNSREGIAEILRGSLLSGGVHVSPKTGMIRTPTPTNSTSKNVDCRRYGDSLSMQVHLNNKSAITDTNNPIPTKSMVKST